MIQFLVRMLWRPWFFPPSVMDDDNVRNAQDWYKTFRPDPSNCYEVELDHAFPVLIVTFAMPGHDPHVVSTLRLASCHYGAARG